MDENRLEIIPSSPTDSSELQQLRQKAQEILNLFHTQHYHQAIQFASEFIGLNPSDSKRNFCHYIIGTSALLSGDISTCLQHLILISPNTSSVLFSHFDFYTEAQKKLIGPITFVLRELFNAKTRDQAEKYRQLLEPFVTPSMVDREKNKEEDSEEEPAVDQIFRLDFKDTLTLNSQITILHNLEEFPGEEYFAMAMRSEEKGLWAQSVAYFTAAFRNGCLKSEYQHLAYPYYSDKPNIILDNQRTARHHFEVLQSMFANRCITVEEYLNFLHELRAVILGINSSQDEEVESIEEMSLEGQPPSSHENSEAPKPLDKKTLKIIDQIEREVFRYDKNITKERDVNEHYQSSKQGPRVTALKEYVLEDTAKNIANTYFSAVWNFCWHTKAMKVAAFLFVIPQLITLVTTSIFFLIYLGYKKNQLSKKASRTADKILKDDQRVNQRLQFVSDLAFNKLLEKDNNPFGKHQGFFRPAEPHLSGSGSGSVAAPAAELPAGFGLKIPRTSFVSAK